MFIARTASNVASSVASSVLSTLTSPILGGSSLSTNPGALSLSTSPPSATGPTALAQSVEALSTADGHVDLLAVADYVSNSINAGFAVAASRVFGYNLEFTVHKQGAVLVTGASSKIGSHAARTLCSLGYAVFAGVRNMDEGRRLRAKCQRDGSKAPCIPIVVDVTSPHSLREAYEFVCSYLGVVTEDGNIVRVSPDRSVVEKAMAGSPTLPTVGEDEEPETEAL
ncbi:hypothetical protein HK405_012058 [Cladochytrium tenue]|nr:hypothetical protein HK405_012058 [Cladochytrium tenue]